MHTAFNSTRVRQGSILKLSDISAVKICGASEWNAIGREAIQ